jgi:methylamine--corrinoid protein Co-methyltransferase
MTLARRVPEMIREYGLKYDPGVLVPADDDMADRLYQAGVTLFVEMGVYNQSTQRRILFSRDEVEAAIGAARGTILLGTGKDTVVMRHRGVESDVTCVVQSGPTGTPCSERYHPLILQSCAQEPLVDCIGTGSLSTYMGHSIIPGTPLEILAVQRDSAVAREAIRKAGRPGMHINDVATPPYLRR